MAKIHDIKLTKAKNGKPLILVQTAEHDVWLTPKEHKSNGGSSSLDVYKGGDIQVDWYKKGQVLFGSDKECTKDFTIKRNYTMSANPQVLAQAKIAEDISSMSEAVDAQALFARMRDDANDEVQKPENTPLANEDPAPAEDPAEEPAEEDASIN